MKKRIFALLTVFALLLGMLTACGSNDPITTDQAQKIALEAASLTQDQVSDIHTHVTEENGIPCYQVHMTTDSGEVTVIVNVTTGEVVSVD